MAGEISPGAVTATLRHWQNFHVGANANQTLYVVDVVAS
jgi:hypothetical protein